MGSSSDSSRAAPFACAHAAHEDWQAALKQCLAQLGAAAGKAPPAGVERLGLLYITEHYAAHAPALLDALQRATQVRHWAGCSAVGVAASGVELFDRPGMTLMLCELPQGSFQVFSGAQPLRRFPAHTALVHADPGTPGGDELIVDLAERCATGYLFGGVASGREQVLQLADGAHAGGLSGVAFDARVELISRVTQGCQPLAPKSGGPARTRTITRAQRNVIYELDGRPALELLFDEQGLDLDDTRAALPALRQILVGLTPANAEAAARAGQFGSDTVVRHLIGIDVGNRGIAIGDLAEEGMQLTFCRRDREAARRDLIRICSEIRSELEPEELSSAALAQQLAAGRPAGAAAAARSTAGAAAARIRGAVYVSCAGRGGPHFAGDAGSSAELRIVQQALGEVPLVGFFAGGEIARHHLYGYTGVLTCFVA